MLRRQIAQKREVPLKVRKDLEQQCDGDWARVTVDNDGAFLVHNNAARAAAFVEADPEKVVEEPPPQTHPLDLLNAQIVGLRHQNDVAVEKLERARVTERQLLRKVEALTEKLAVRDGRIAELEEQLAADTRAATDTINEHRAKIAEQANVITIQKERITELADKLATHDREREAAVQVLKDEIRDLEADLRHQRAAQVRTEVAAEAPTPHVSPAPGSPSAEAPVSGQVIVPGPGKYGCPECAAGGEVKAFERPQSLSSHRRYQHGVEGSSKRSRNLRIAREREMEVAAPRAPDPQTVALKHLVENRPSPITPGVKVVSAPPREREAGLAVLQDTKAAEHFDWAAVDLESTAHALRMKLQHGLPAAIPVTYKPDVLALEGCDVDELSSVLRHPTRVEIRPESYDKSKGYPVLGFYRGDISVILGMQNPTAPAVIAAYWTSLLANDHHRVNHTGGGGARGSRGLPKDVKSAVKQLRANGAKVEWDEFGDKPVEVIYQGQKLGKISVGPGVTRSVVESDYQRMIRKMHAIDQRAAAS